MDPQSDRAGGERTSGGLALTATGLAGRGWQAGLPGQQRRGTQAPRPGPGYSGGRLVVLVCHGQRPVSSTSSEKLKKFRIKTMMPRTPTLVTRWRPSRSGGMPRIASSANGTCPAASHTAIRRSASAPDGASAA